MEEESRLKVFLSSALVGLEDLRAVLIDFLEKEKGYQIIYYGDKCSGPLTGKTVESCLKGVRCSNFLVLIIDKRYGSVNPQDDDDILQNDEGIPISLTEREYLEATKHGIQVFPYCRDEVCMVRKIWKTNPKMNFKWDKDHKYDNPKKLMNFLDKLKEKYLVQQFHNAIDLKDTLSRNKFYFDELEVPSQLTDENENVEVVS